MQKNPEPKDFLKDLGLRVIGAVIAVGLIFLLAFLGDFFDIGFLDSGGGLLVATILVMEGLFFSAITYMALKGKI